MRSSFPITSSSGGTPLASILVVASLFFGAAASAEESGEGDAARARGYFERGVELSAQSDFEGALEAFQSSFEIRPNAGIRYNLGVCHLQLEQWAEARRELGAYLAEIDQERISPERRQEVVRVLADIDARVALLDIHLVQEGAAILIDGVEIGAAPLSIPVAVAPGSVEVTVTLDGHEPFTRSYEVGAGERESIDVHLRPLPEPTPPQPEIPPEPVPPAEDAMIEPVAEPPAAPPTELVEPEGRGVSALWFGLATGLALALGVSGTVTGALVQSSYSEFDAEIDACNQRGDAECHEAHDVASSGRTLGMATTIFLPIAGAAAIAALVLAFFTDWGGDASRGGAAPILGLSGGGRSIFLLDASFRF